METQGYGTFSQSLQAAIGASRVPLSATIEVTRRCPLTCVHCYNNLPMNDGEARRRELSFEEHCRILDEIAEAGCLWLLYTGGEIFARKDFLDIYRHAKTKGLLITLFTNGTLITTRVADALAALRPFAIEVTLYGRTRETYERLTGIPGSYDKCLQGIRRLRERGLPLKLKTVAVTVNRHEVQAMQRFAEDELGVEFKFDEMMNPRLDCSASPLEVRLSPEACVQFDLEDPKRMGEWRLFHERFSAIARASEKADEVYQCGGGANSFAINPYGEMSLCTLSQKDLYDLRLGSFREGWERFLGQVRVRKVTRLTKCVACEMKAMCGMCPANGELENGDPESPVDFLCRVAHLRAHTFGFGVTPHGSCEYCPGGEQHEDLMRAVARLKQTPPAEPAADERPRTRTLLPMINEALEPSVGCASSTCHSCHRHPNIEPTVDSPTADRISKDQVL
jgi:radical SAM protein with 4Fe4S-binding SPASM domain